MKTILKMTYPLLLIIVLFISWLIYAAQATETITVYSKGFKNHNVNSHDLVNGKFDPKLQQIDEYAMLSSFVYEPNEDKKVAQYKNWKKSKLSVIESGREDALKGLYYEVWFHQKEDQPTIAAIVFKGSESANDWKTNARWIRKLINPKTYDYYDQLNDTADTLISQIKNEANPKSIVIVTAGHSLGGGLAQFMAYRINEIKTVYAFNPSPVTAFYDVDAKTRKQNKQDCNIYRIYESGEALSPIRKLMTIIYPVPLFKTKNPALIRIRTSFITGKDSVKQHGIIPLAQKLTSIKSIPN